MYKAVEHKLMHGIKGLEDEINKMAEEGWELVSYAPGVSFWKKEKGGCEGGGCGGSCGGKC